MGFLRASLLLIGLLGLAACGSPFNGPNADPAEVSRAVYRHDGPPEIMLVTMKNARSDGGAHTALLINGSQRLLYDPAGSFRHPNVPEVNDVLYGFTPLIKTVYVDYHVRPTYYMIQQYMPVSLETADRLIALAQDAGRAGNAQCALKTSGILRAAGIDVRRTWFPDGLMDSFGQLPNVSTRRVDMTNVDTNHNVIFGQGGIPAPQN